MRDPDTGWIQLHVGEFFLLWTSLDLGETPAALDIPRLGRTASARAELVDSVSRTLADRDLGTVTEPARDLAALLRALSAPELTLDLHYAGADFDVLAISCFGAHGGASAGVFGEELRIGPVRRPIMAMSMLDVVEPADAGIGGPANLRVDDYQRACAAGERHGIEGFADALRDARIRPAEINTVVRAVTQRVGGGQFGGSVRSRGGQWHRTPSPVNWVDTPDGRFALRRKGDWLTVTPVDPPRLRGMIEQMADDLDG